MRLTILLPLLSISASALAYRQYYAYDKNVNPGFQAWSGAQCNETAGDRHYIHIGIKKDKKQHIPDKCYQTGGRHSMVLYEIDGLVYKYASEDCTGRAWLANVKNDTCYPLKADYAVQSVRIRTKCVFAKKDREMVICPDGDISTHQT